jgi:tetratricopeptide (TPR) repeat protein
MNEENSPMNILARAQIAISRKEYKTAAQTFTLLMDKYPQMSKALPLLSRCTCYFELKEFEKCIADAKEVLTFPDQPFPEELVSGSGCYTTHSAANFHIARAYRQLGDEDSFNKYQKQASKVAQANAMDVSKAQDIRMEGNKFFEMGDTEKAMEKYKEALKIDPTSEIICGNICTIHYKNNEMDEAEFYANECIRLNPDWPKGYFKKGMVLLKKGEYLDSMNCFIKGLELAPDDVEMKKLYMKTSELCQNGPKAGGFNKRVMGILMEVQSRSWDVLTWYIENFKSITFIPYNEYKDKFIEQFDKIDFKKSVENAVKTKYSDYKMNTNLKEFLSSKDDNYEAIYKKEHSENKEMTVYDYVLKSDTLISFSYFLTLVKLAYPDINDWNLVITFSYPENPRDVSGIPNNPIYGAFISKEEKLIIDVYSETTNIFGGLQSFKDLMRMNIEQQKNIYEQSKKDNVVNMSQVVTLYTFDKEYLYNEFLESYMEGEKIQYELKHKINSNKLKSKPKQNQKSSSKTTLSNSSSSSSIDLDKEMTSLDDNNKDKNDVGQNNNQSDNKLKKRNVKKRKEIKVEPIPLNPNKNKKPDSEFKRKFKAIQKTRAYRVIENSLLFFIIFFIVRNYSALLSFIYGNTFKLVRDAFKTLNE